MTFEEDLKKILDGQAGIKKDILEKTNEIKKYLASLKTEVNRRLTDQDTKIMNLEKEIEGLKNRDSVREEAVRKQFLLNELYSKRFNIIIYNIPEAEAWETKEETLKKIIIVLKDGLKIENAEVEIKILDCHRLPQHPLPVKDKDSQQHNLRNRTIGGEVKNQKIRPIIFKVESAFDLQKIWSNISHLKVYNAVLAKGKRPKIFFAKQLPKELLVQKKKT